MKRASLILALAAFTAHLSACESQPKPVAPPPKSDVDARAMVDKATASTGDTLEFRVEVDARAELEVTIKDPGPKIQGLRILDSGREGPKKEGQRAIRTLWYSLRGDLVGSYILPAVQVEYRDPTQPEQPVQTVETSEIFVEITSVLPTDGSATDIRGIKPLRRVQAETPWEWYLGLGIGLALLILGLAIWLRKKRQAHQDVPPVPAHTQAFASLDALRQTNFDDPEAVRKYYFDLSEVIRTYIEGRYALNATDLTTEELLPQVSDRQLLSPTLNGELRTFLKATDAIKFAGHEPSSSDIEQDYERALKFVEATVPPPQEPSEGATP